MEKKFDKKFWIMRFSVYALSLLLAVSILLGVFQGIALAMFSSQSFVEGKIGKYSAQCVEQIADAMKDLPEKTDLPLEAYTNLTDDNVSTIISKISKNFVKRIKMDFSDDEEIYAIFNSAILKYCNDNNIAVSQSDIDFYSSLAVKAFNDNFCDDSVTLAFVFKYVRSDMSMYVLIFSVVAFIAAIILLDVLSYGRHKKYDYYGMAFVASGGLITLLIAYAFASGKLGKIMFCQNEIYNASLYDAFKLMLAIAFAIGFVFFVVGIVLLIKNYFYFKKKRVQVKSVREDTRKMKNDYLEQLNEKIRRENRPPVNKDEKIVDKIDFD